MKIIATVVALIALSGCVTPAAMENMMAEWEGATLEEVVRHWGAPADQVQTGELTTYSWDSSYMCPRRLTFKDDRVIAWSQAEDMAATVSTECPFGRWKRP